jgi:hypothetical protein
MLPDVSDRRWSFSDSLEHFTSPIPHSPVRLPIYRASTSEMDLEVFSWTGPIDPEHLIIWFRRWICRQTARVGLFVAAQRALRWAQISTGCCSEERPRRFLVKWANIFSMPPVRCGSGLSSASLQASRRRNQARKLSRSSPRSQSLMVRDRRRRNHVEEVALPSPFAFATSGGALLTPFLLHKLLCRTQVVRDHYLWQWLPAREACRRCRPSIFRFYISTASMFVSKCVPWEPYIKVYCCKIFSDV